MPDVSISQEPAEGSRKSSETSADLQAQQSMALAAWSAVGVSAFGLIGLFFTVRYALFAWRSAEKSADADNKALELARTQLDEARQANMAQLRAYLSVQDLQVNNFSVGDKPRFEFLIRNNGNTPAYDVQYIAQVYLSDDPKAYKVRFPSIEWQSKLIVAPSYANSGFVGGDTVMTKAAYEAVMSGKLVPVLAGYIVYRDIFKKRRYVTFRATFERTHFEDGHGFLTLANKHNRAN